MTTTAYLILAGIGGYAALLIGILLFFRGSHCWDDDDLRQESMASGWAPSHEGGKGSLMALRQSTHPDSSR